MTDRAGPYPPRRAPLDTRAMRQEHLGLVLGEVVRRPPISKAELVTAAGLKTRVTYEHGNGARTRPVPCRST